MVSFHSKPETFLQDAGVAPFLEVRLSATGGAEVLDLAWNPGAEFAAILASCTSDGSLNLWEIGEGLRVVASLPPAIGAQACKKYIIKCSYG